MATPQVAMAATARAPQPGRAQVEYNVVDRRTVLAPDSVPDRIRQYLIQNGPSTKAEIQAAFEAAARAPAGSLMKSVESALYNLTSKRIAVSVPIQAEAADRR